MNCTFPLPNRKSAKDLEMKSAILCAALALGLACTAEASLRSDLLSLHSVDAVTSDGEAPWCDTPSLFTIVQEICAQALAKHCSLRVSCMLQRAQR